MSEALNTTHGAEIDGFEDSPRFEDVEALQYDIAQEGKNWFVTRENGGKIPIPSELGNAIQIALRVQTKADEALEGTTRRGLLEKISLMNCRKTAWAVRHPEELRRLISSPGNIQELSREEKEALSGIPELRHEIEALFATGHTPIIGTGDDLHIESYLEDHPQEMPVVVHVFHAPMRRSDELVTRAFGSDEEGITVDYVLSSLNRDHTFIVLGKDQEGRYACFHKQGPAIDNKFEIIDLESTLLFAVADSESKVFMSAIGPIDAVKEVKPNEEKLE